MDSQLVGISVIDILPHCVSSVYFIWHKDYAWASLGKLSALCEAALARSMRDAGADVRWLYMGESTLADVSPLTHRLLDSRLSEDAVQRGVCPFVSARSGL